MKKNNFFLVAFMAIALTGCGRTNEDVSDAFRVPAALKDCSFHRMRGDADAGWERIIVVRCPNSDTTTTTTGKNPKRTTVISP